MSPFVRSTSSNSPADLRALPVIKRKQALQELMAKARDNRAVTRDLLRRQFVACFLGSRNAVEPRLCRLQLRGKRQQGRFFAVAAREMYTDRQTIRRPVQRHAHRRRAGCVMQRCHRQIFRDAFGEGLNIAALVEISEFRGRSGRHVVDSITS